MKPQMKLFMNSSPDKLEEEFNAWSTHGVDVLHVQTFFSATLQKFYMTVVWVICDMDEEDEQPTVAIPDAAPEDQEAPDSDDA